MRSFLFTFALTMGLLSTGCVPAPRKDYAPAEIAEIEEVDEVMRVQAKYMDPLFGIRGQETFTDQQFAAMVEAAKMLDATSAALVDRHAVNFAPAFSDLAMYQRKEAGSLRAAALESFAPGANEALRKAKANCAACHEEFD